VPVSYTHLDVYKRQLVLVASLRIAAAQPVPLPPGTTTDDQEQKQQTTDPLGDVESAIEEKNYTMAAARLELFLSAHPQDARALFDRGYVEDAQGHTDAAQDWYLKAVAADPKQFEAHVALGLLFASKGDSPVSYTHLDVYKRQEPGH